MLIILSGSSGVGKNTIINRMLEECDNLELMPTVTTRGMREGESQGKPYVFETREGFQAMIDRGEMVEYCEIHGNLYGTNRRILEEKIAGGKILIKDIDVEGTLNLMKLLPDVISIYLKPVSKEQLVERLRGRGETEIELRLRRYEYEEQMAEHYNYVLVNDKMEDTIAKIYTIIEKKAKLHRRAL